MNELARAARHPFITARQLRERFAAFGHFYELPSGAEAVRCRSVLELLSHARAAALDEKRRGLPDAVFVMMNPGSSRPLHSGGWDGGVPSRTSKRLVPARPDTTQYQVMRVMARMHWEHVRVINLSDLYESQSSEFVRRYPGLGHAAHSIFAAERRSELAQELQRQDGAPLVLAWGVHARLAPLIAQALPVLKAAGPCFGVQRPDAAGGGYFHLLPQQQQDKIARVDALCAQLLATAPAPAHPQSRSPAPPLRHP